MLWTTTLTCLYFITYAFFSSIRLHTRLQGDCSADVFFFFSSRRRHTRLQGDWSSDVCSSDLFLFISLVLAFMSAHSAAPRSVLEGGAPAPAPVQPTPLPLPASPAPQNTPPQPSNQSPPPHR